MTTIKPYMIRPLLHARPNFEESLNTASFSRTITFFNLLYEPGSFNHFWINRSIHIPIFFSHSIHRHWCSFKSVWININVTWAIHSLWFGRWAAGMERVADTFVQVCFIGWRCGTACVHESRGIIPTLFLSSIWKWM